MTCRDNNSLVKDLESNILGTIMTMATSTDPGTDQITGLVDPEPGLLVGRECIVLTPGTTKIMTPEKLPVRMIMTKGTMTLAMGDTIEGAARRPCFMGGPL